MSLNDVKDVEIDSNGRFKYILIKLSEDSTNTSKIVVRGNQEAGYHADIFDELEDSIKGKKIRSDCLGGGRILHESDKKHILVYGYSQGFGRADHKITVDLLKKAYPDYNIEWSNEGY